MYTPDYKEDLKTRLRLAHPCLERSFPQDAQKLFSCLYQLPIEAIKLELVFLKNYEIPNIAPSEEEQVLTRKLSNISHYIGRVVYALYFGYPKEPTYSIMIRHIDELKKSGFDFDSYFNNNNHLDLIEP